MSEFKKFSTQKIYTEFLDKQNRRDLIPGIRSLFENHLPYCDLAAVFVLINMDQVENEN